MIHVEISNITKIIGYDLFPKRKVSIKVFNYNFVDGKCYCLGYKDFSGYLISLIIAGKIKNRNINISSEKKMPIVNLKEQAILMGIEENTDKKNNLLYALKKYKENNINYEKIFEKYGISEQRQCRKMKNMSSERWRVSFALGEILEKKIYCFPWIPSEIIDMYSNLWFSDFLNEIKRKGGIIIIPTEITEINMFLFDEVLE